MFLHKPFSTTIIPSELKNGIKGLLTIIFILFAVVAMSESTSDIEGNKVIVKQQALQNLQIAKSQRLINYDTALFYANQAFTHADNVNNEQLMIESLIMMAGLNNNIGNSKRSLELYEKAKEKAKSIDNYELIADTYHGIAGFYNSKFNYFKVIEVLDSALNLTIKYNLTSAKPKVYQRIGVLYYRINDFPLAEYYANLAQSIIDPEATILNVNNIHLIASIALKRNDTLLALKTYNEALKVGKDAENLHAIQLSYRRIAAYYMDVRNYKLANIYIDSSLHLCNELEYRIEKSALITYKAHLHSLKKDYKGALKYNIQALNIRRNTGHRAAISSSMLNIGGNYTELGDYEKAKIYIDSGMIMAKNQKILSFISLGYYKLSLLYRRLGNFEKALDYYELKTTYTDSVLNIRNNEKVLFFSNMLDSERAKRQIDIIELKRKSNNIIFLIATTILSSLLILLLFRINYLRKKKNKEISKLSKVIETTDQAVVLTDKNGELNYVNNGLLNLLGFKTRKEVKGNIFSFTDVEGKKIIMNEALPALNSNKPWKGEINIIKKDNTIMIAELTCTTLLDDKKSPELFVSIFSDITLRKKNEIDLKTSRESLKKTVETQDRMFSIIAHDLIGPFSTILGFSKMLSEDYFKYEQKDHIRFSRIINQSSKQTYELLNNLLHWSRSQLGRIEIFKENINLYKIADEALKLLDQSLKNKEISLINEIDINFTIYADGPTISMVIRNLLSNAVKFTPRGGEIKISGSVEGDYSKIVICDNGVGMTEDFVVDLFNPDGGNTTVGTENEKGTGLGMILCNDLIKLHDGTIRVDSEPGKGTCFYISLPSERISNPNAY